MVSIETVLSETGNEAWKLAQTKKGLCQQMMMMVANSLKRSTQIDNYTTTLLHNNKKKTVSTNIAVTYTPGQDNFLIDVFTFAVADSYTTYM